MSELTAHDWRNLINILFFKTATLNKAYYRLTAKVNINTSQILTRNVLS